MKSNGSLKTFIIGCSLYLLPCVVSAQYTPMMDTIFTKDLLVFRTFNTVSHFYDNKVMNGFRFNKNDLPFFCKIEHKIETGSKIGFRFRLGDLNYVNMLENKK
ncbi:MAG: hypothetical protein WAU01_05780 [Saprospiraceae bacterium]